MTTTMLFSFFITLISLFTSSSFLFVVQKFSFCHRNQLTQSFFSNLIHFARKKDNTKRRLESNEDLNEDLALNLNMFGLDVNISDIQVDVSHQDSTVEKLKISSSSTTNQDTDAAFDSIKMKPVLRKENRDNIDISRKQRIEEIIKRLAQECESLIITKMCWFSGRLEVTVTDTLMDEAVVKINAEQLQNLHKAIYSELELFDEAFLVENEVIVASPGIGDVLRTDQDFVSFNGFPVAISTTDEFKSKTLFEGSLIDRDDEFVRISIKGRIVSVPRAIVKEVRMPKPKIIEGDTEMSKLG